ncbi:MAG: hypothetical protein F6K54_28335 [Okeania sp. SIO3B5]|uniref:hypothetical protein n=1 Tax=Okeania sp. SIO3B5 TaxID=2607811 RepID=UPI0013FEC723|nr:hypothetical protein [Okeania sp. SIO3B5]NEO56639.1 hypothetical protein [Okeania sp. SIO3B5]
MTHLSSNSQTNDSGNKRQVADLILDTVYTKLNINSDFNRLYDDIVTAISLAPDYTNNYFCLYKVLIFHGKEQSQLYKILIDTWKERGQDSTICYDFITLFKEGFPFEITAELKKTIQDVALIIKISDDIRYIDLLEFTFGSPQGDYLYIGRIPDPKLICSIRDFDSLTTGKLTIIEDLIKKGKDKRIIGHLGTWISCDERTVFGPAIDTVYYNYSLHKTIYTNETFCKSVKTIFEVGTGTGFLLCSMIGKFHNNNPTILGSDASEKARKVAIINIKRTISDLHISDNQIQFNITLDEDSLKNIPDNSIDILLTNPPYIPEYDVLDYNPYSGTKVIKDVLVTYGHKKLSRHGILIILYSSLCARKIDEYLKQSHLFPFKLGVSKKVPLDLREVSRDTRWIDMLKRNHGLEQQLYHDKYLYWHELTMLALVKNRATWENHFERIE